MSTAVKSAGRDALSSSESFVDRHLGPSEQDVQGMLETLGLADLGALTDAVVPAAIRTRRPLDLPSAAGEAQALAELRALAAKNQVWRSFIGCGYHDSLTPAVLLRNILENPGWYTQYTPYQAEISQGRLEALLNFQTLIAELTGLAIANASMLDEGTSAAEAMTLCRSAKGSGSVFFAAEDCHPQTLEVLRTRAKHLGIRVETGDPEKAEFSAEVFGVLLQYPGTSGVVRDYEALCARVHKAGALAVFAADPLALAILKSPGEMGADAVVGSIQRFGLPLGFGGPGAGYMAVKAAFLRQMPGRIVGMSKDSGGQPALRLAVQTREQHIRREKATSNICTSQVLTAVIASMYAAWHGPQGLRRIAERVHLLTRILSMGLRRLGLELEPGAFFDTLRVRTHKAAAELVLEQARGRRINLRAYPDGSLGISLDEKTDERDLTDLLACFAKGKAVPAVEELSGELGDVIPEGLRRGGEILSQPVFHRYHSETEMLRYLKRLESRDLSLTTSMIPLGSCTMKLNAASEMLPITWPEFTGPHPFAPEDQVAGYRELFSQLERWLCEITGFEAVSLQPNAGSQGEYAGLLVLRKYHESRGEGRRDVCLIPQSAHGTNPASAALAGLRVVPVACDSEGNIDLADLQARAAEHAETLAALMVTYPSTHGVFEEEIREMCKVVHERGGQVYMDGANMNAQVGLCRPAELGADVCHLNLHKTFAMPHGGGGPGVGPIAVKGHLAAFLPGHPLVRLGGKESIGAVCSAPWGSANLLPISWMYIRMMGGPGLTRATQVAILNANYIARRLAGHFPVVYKGRGGFVAHECILDLRNLKNTSGVQVEDVAKRLMDYGFHAPTMSWPVGGTLMVEPTESESKEELDRFCDAMISIRSEITAVEQGRLSKDDNPLKNAPHTAEHAVAEKWTHPYSRKQAVFPAPWLKERKFWPAVGRVDNPYGDRNLFCVCPPVKEG
ncbi:MAG: aminomethyl-transferring glycine dehydrogenase [Elusimicrobiota bacterium]|jgi:glycine dehydrogenase